MSWGILKTIGGLKMFEHVSQWTQEVFTYVVVVYWYVWWCAASNFRKTSGIKALDTHIENLQLEYQRTQQKWFIHIKQVGVGVYK